MTTSDLALPLWVGMTVVPLVCALALWKGEWPERLTAVAWLIGWAVTEGMRQPSFAQLQWGGFAVTLVNLALLIGIALRSNREWVLWGAGFQLLNVVTHAARILDSTVGAWAYATAMIIWSYLLLFALAFGVWGCIRRRRVERANAQAVTRRDAIHLDSL